MVENSLFNQPLMNRYLKKYKKELKLTHTKKTDVIKWIKKLENGDLKDEVSNYGFFSRLILESLLGYDYEENIEENVKEDYGRGFSEFAIKKDGKKFMVIELKGSDSDLDKPQQRKNDKRTPVDQAFDYAKRSGDINWILVSNYDEFRLYNWHKKQHQFISFKAEELKDPEKFKTFMLILSKFSTIENNLIEKMVSKTIFVERDLEAEFYKLFNETRLMLISEIEHIHPEFTRDQSVHYSQLILNRYIFICFAEDLGLLPGEISVETIENPIKTDTLGRSEIWHRLNDLFINVDVGNDVRKEKIFGYNGGLFKEDLEFLKIRDVINDHSIFQDAYQKWKFEEYSLIVEAKLGSYSGKINPIYKNLMTMSTFNFSSEVDVNILGHIFENSIGDIEELKADEKGRRKKDGIFYTPGYITDYICRNTIIPYLSKSGKSNTVDDLIGEHWGSEIEELYENVKNIKIVDPACGSGAFLNKASDILLEIHEAIRKEQYKDDKTLMPYFDNIKERRKILLNNIYGVDLNEESVEITKLSLFLKVSRKGLKLPNLDNNIKCGNSLIDDPHFTDKPFNWEEQFPEIFSTGGFDVVIGNPPWGAKLDKKSKDFIKNHYKTPEYQINSYVVFMEKNLNLTKKEGLLGIIVPLAWLTMHYFKKIRKLFIKNTIFEKIVVLKYNAFEDVTSESSILCVKKSIPKSEQVMKVAAIPEEDKFNSMVLKDIRQELWRENVEIGFNAFFNEQQTELVNKIYEYVNNPLIHEANVKAGIKPYEVGKGNPKQTREDVDNRIYDSNWKKSPDYQNYVIGGNIKRYKLDINDKLWIKFGEWLAAPRKIDFSKNKIVIRRTGDRILATVDFGGYLNLNSVFNIYLKDESKLKYKYLLCLLNSKLIDFVYKYLVPDFGRVFSEIKGVNLEKLPIISVNVVKQQHLIEKTDKMLQLNCQLQEEINGFKRWIQKEFNVEKFSKKLDKYYELKEDEFIDELRKKKVDTKSRKNREYLEREFNESLAIIKPLLQEIEETDHKIDLMVYDLYGLNDEEIEIIEQTLKE